VTDVEQQEIRHPLLYLWRRMVADSGGAGAHRGGNGTQFALTPIDTDEVTRALGTHGVALPNRTGLFGGLPGSCARFERVTGAATLDRLGSGEPVTSLGDLDGDHQVLPSVAPAARIASGDVFEYTVQNGGGYGDPLLRDPGKVAADIDSGAVSPEAAARLYGVVLREGTADPSATAARREEIRESRRTRMTAPEPGTPTTAGPPTGIWGGSLHTHDSSGGVLASCRHCGHVLGHLAAVGSRSPAGSCSTGPTSVTASKCTAPSPPSPTSARTASPRSGWKWSPLRAPWRDFALA